jgi:hypothetical protein
MIADYDNRSGGRSKTTPVSTHGGTQVATANCCTTDCSGAVHSPTLTYKRNNGNFYRGGAVSNDLYIANKKVFANPCCQPCFSLIENFSTGSLGNSDLFIPLADHVGANIEIVESSAVWPGPNSKSPFWNGGYGHDDGHAPGFNSLAAPLPTPYHVRFVVSHDRYLKSKKFDFTNLVSITVSFIAGGINGEFLTSHQKKVLQTKLSDPTLSNKAAWQEAFLDPSFEHLPSRYLISSPPLPPLPSNSAGWKIPFLSNGGDIPDVSAGPPRVPEELVIQFYTKYDQKIGNSMMIFASKDRPAVVGQGDLYIYGSSKFSTKTFYTTDKAILNQASYFKIHQNKGTDLLDNYGIKYVQCNFCNDRQMFLPDTPPDTPYEVFVHKVD